jgi:hypothetical protein
MNEKINVTQINKKSRKHQDVNDKKEDLVATRRAASIWRARVSSHLEIK